MASITGGLKPRQWVTIMHVKQGANIGEDAWSMVWRMGKDVKHASSTKARDQSRASMYFLKFLLVKKIICDCSQKCNVRLILQLVRYAAEHRQRSIRPCLMYLEAIMNRSR